MYADAYRLGFGLRFRVEGFSITWLRCCFTLQLKSRYQWVPEHVSDVSSLYFRFLNIANVLSLLINGAELTHCWSQSNQSGSQDRCHPLRKAVKQLDWEPQNIQRTHHLKETSNLVVKAVGVHVPLLAKLTFDQNCGSTWESGYSPHPPVCNVYWRRTEWCGRWASAHSSPSPPGTGAQYSCTSAALPCCVYSLALLQTHHLTWILRRQLGMTRAPQPQGQMSSVRHAPLAPQPFAHSPAWLWKRKTALGQAYPVVRLQSAGHHPFLLLKWPAMGVRSQITYVRVVVPKIPRAFYWYNADWSDNGRSTDPQWCESWDNAMVSKALIGYCFEQSPKRAYQVLDLCIHPALQEELHSNCKSTQTSHS